MKVQESFVITEPRERLWSFFEQVDKVAQCVPGVESVEQVDADNSNVRVTQSVGPMTATFDIKPTLRSTTTGGVQFTREYIEGVRAQGAKLLGGTGSLQGAAARFVVGETNTDNRTFGGLISEQITSLTYRKDA